MTEIAVVIVSIDILNCGHFKFAFVVSEYLTVIWVQYEITLWLKLLCLQKYGAHCFEVEGRPNNQLYMIFRNNSANIKL
jgi:hypothetical protein